MQGMFGTKKFLIRKVATQYGQKTHAFNGVPSTDGRLKIFWCQTLLTYKLYAETEKNPTHIGRNYRSYLLLVPMTNVMKMSSIYSSGSWWLTIPCYHFTKSNKTKKLHLGKNFGTKSTHTHTYIYIYIYIFIDIYKWSTYIYTNTYINIYTYILTTYKPEKVFMKRSFISHI